MARKIQNQVPDGAEGFVCPRCRQYRTPEECYWKPNGRRHGWCRLCVNSDASARHAQTYSPKPERSGICEHCAGPFTTKRDGKRFCSRKCGELARGEREKQERLARPARQCQGCEADITGRRSDVVWCSDGCAGKRPSRRGAVRRSRLKRLYGLTVEQYDAMLAKQRGRCAICGSTEPKHTNWSVDHDHVTGQVRGILCSACNTGIGQLQDDPDIVRKALEYIVKHRQTVLPI